MDLSSPVRDEPPAPRSNHAFAGLSQAVWYGSDVLFSISTCAVAPAWSAGVSRRQAGSRDPNVARGLRSCTGMTSVVNLVDPPPDDVADSSTVERLIITTGLVDGQHDAFLAASRMMSYGN